MVPAVQARAVVQQPTALILSYLEWRFMAGEIIVLLLNGEFSIATFDDRNQYRVPQVVS